MRKDLDWLPSSRTCSCVQKAQNCLTEDEWLGYQVPVWRFDRRELRGDFERNSRLVHPAIFPRALPRRLIELYTHNGETVLDVFSGVGTSLVAAIEAGRNAVGIELNPKYTALARRRLAYIRSTRTDRQKRFGCKPSAPSGHQFTADARNTADLLAPNTIDLAVTSPPYWDLLKQRQSERNRKSGKYLKNNYSNDGRDLSNQETLEGFLDGLNDIFYQIKRVLRPGKRFVIVTGDYRKRGKYIPLHKEYIGMLNNMGMRLNNIFIWDRSNEYDIGLYCYPEYFIAANGMVEYILEFQK